MTQSRRRSALESFVNTVSGLLISFGIQLAIYPIMGIPVRLHQNVIITLVFTLASLGRGYIIRRIFNR